MQLASNAAFGERSHNIFDLGKFAAETATWMKAGEVFWTELTHPAQDQCQGIAQRHHGGRAGAGCQAVWASFP